MTVRSNGAFRKQYDRIFERSPLAANVFLLIAELANDKGRVKTTEEELTVLFNTRFDDPKAYQLHGGMQ